FSCVSYGSLPLALPHPRQSTHPVPHGASVKRKISGVYTDSLSILFIFLFFLFARIIDVLHPGLSLARLRFMIGGIAVQFLVIIVPVRLLSAVVDEIFPIHDRIEANRLRTDNWRRYGECPLVQER